MITRFFGDKVAIAEPRRVGESLKSSLGAKRPGQSFKSDASRRYLLIQYGHNDEKKKVKASARLRAYKASLKQFVDAVETEGGIPILITPMHRRTFDANGKITNSHGDYPDAVRQIAKDEKLR
jgi:lysophospholipase L1-like esterase